MACRYGEGFAGERAGLPYGQAVSLGEARVTLYPAGHILGSAQVLIEYGGARIGISGDYKRTHDPRARVRAHRLRCLRHRGHLRACRCSATPIHGTRSKSCSTSLAVFPESCHTVGCYALGKTQRLIAELRRAGYDKPIYLMAR